MNEYEIREITRNYPLSLLLDADPDIKKIEKYLNKGRDVLYYPTEQQGCRRPLVGHRGKNGRRKDQTV